MVMGGSKVAPEFGTMLVDERADIITILWGLNDKSRDNDLPLFVTKYEALLDNLRVAQPRTPIYCITMITCSYEGPGSNGYTLDDYRGAIANVVAARQAAGDCHMHLVHGEALTTLADLTDGTHLSVPGAAHFADELRNVIDSPWGDFDHDGSWSVDDWTMLASCLAGPNVTPPAGACDGFDYDCDGDVDLQEFAALQIRFGP